MTSAPPSEAVEGKSPYRAIVAFSGEPEWQGEQVTEAKLNGFPSSKIAEQIREDPHRFLVCADKFQTGYDEPLLHTMYVDKPLSGVNKLVRAGSSRRWGVSVMVRRVFALGFAVATVGSLVGAVPAADPAKPGISWGRRRSS